MAPAIIAPAGGQFFDISPGTRVKPRALENKPLIASHLTI